MGTGQTLALLPPQNATGNFVKIVQRLPVRIELTDYDPDKLPLFVGLSVEPHVYYQGAADGAARRGVPATATLPAARADAERLNRIACRWRRASGNGSADPSELMSSVALRLPRRPPGDQPLVHRRSPSSCPRSWRCSTRRSPTSRCATSPAACRRPRPTASGSSPATWPPTPSSCRSPAGSRPSLGRRNYFLLSIAVFTLASGLCGMATSLPQMILFRVIQGLAGGGLQPSSQGDPARQLSAREAGHGHDACSASRR